MLNVWWHRYWILHVIYAFIIISVKCKWFWLYRRFFFTISNSENITIDQNAFSHAGLMKVFSIHSVASDDSTPWQTSPKYTNKNWRAIYRLTESKMGVERLSSYSAMINMHWLSRVAYHNSCLLQQPSHKCLKSCVFNFHSFHQPQDYIPKHMPHQILYSIQRTLEPLREVQSHV